MSDHPAARARITVLVDNTAHTPGLATEHGLAMALEISQPGSDHNILWLWDTGQSDAFLKNAAQLGVNPAQAQGLALSHGHYDHTGGLAALLTTGFGGAILAHPQWITPRFSVHPGERPRAIGFEAAPRPASLPDVTPVSRSWELAPGLTMLADIPRLPGNPQNTKDFFFDPQGRDPDPVRDDACLVLHAAQGPVLILGCCHSGLENTLACVAERMGVTTLHGVLGGLHLMNSGPEDVDRAARALRDFGVERVVPGHCTGQAAFRRLRNALGSGPGIMVEPLGSGLVLEF